ncbi:MAG: sigma 54-interacting transcriptional regulator [Kofleriaceae bacterium]
MSPSHLSASEPTVGGELAASPRPTTSGWVLVVLRHGAIEEHALPVGRTLEVGRDEGAAIRINHRSVSRTHARLTVSDAGVEIVDLGSRNGTTVAGRPLGREPQLASDGETVVFGEIACHVMVARRSEYRSELRVEPAEFDRRLAYEGERALRHDQSVSAIAVVFIDTDLDAQQRSLRALAGSIRDLDVYAIRSPERVDVMIVEADRAAAHAQAEQIAAAIAGVSRGARVGVATFPGDAPSPSLLAQAAEMAALGETNPGVYVAKDAVRVLRFAGLEIIVADRSMHRVFGLLERVAPTDLSVLILGETGTGKEVAAHALHALGPRSGHALVALNCAALPENLLESELFGHERGAFSGAVATKQGLFEQASGGTVFLDEIGEMHPTLQAKLLRVLESKRIRRVGGIDERPVDVRVVSATHRDLERGVARGEFRQDLLFRLRGMQIELPPLRERPRELVLLAARFLADGARAAKRGPISIGHEAAEVLAGYAWPGNIRELRHAMSVAAVMVEGDELVVADLPETVRGAKPVGPPAEGIERADVDLAELPLDEAVRAYERMRIQRALDAGGNQSAAARLLGIPRKTLVSKLKALGMRRED